MTRRATATAAVLSLLLTSALGVVAIPAAASPAAPPPPATPPPSATPPPPPSAKVQRYLVKTDSRSATAGVARDVRDAGGRVDNVYSEAMTGFAATMDTEQAASVASDDQVQAVTPDLLFHSAGVQTNPTWGLDRVDQRSASRNGSYRYNTTGAGVTAFVVDTGIRTSHRQFGGRASSGYDFVDDDGNAADCNGHGTHVAGTIGGSTYGAAKGVKLVGVRVLDCEGSGWASDIIDGLDWVIAHKPAGPAVVNMSIGGRRYDAIDRAVERTVAAGVPVVVAAGNDGSDACAGSPARAPHAITVAATNTRDERPSWSNYGRCVDLFAPGVDVRSASIASTSASLVESGTSMASPHVAGVLARYLQTHPRITPAQATAAVVAAATTQKVKKRQGSPDRLVYAWAPPVVPGGPTKVKVSKSSRKRTGTIRWAVPRDNGGATITSYRVTRSGKDTGGAGPMTVTVSAKSRKHTFSRLRKGYTYTLTVRAVNALGAGTVVAKKLAKLH